MANGIIVPSSDNTAWIEVNTYVDYKLINQVCYVKIKQAANAPSSWAELASLPVSCPVNLLQTVYVNFGNSTYTMIRIDGNKVYSNGTVTAVAAVIAFPY